MRELILSVSLLIGCRGHDTPAPAPAPTPAPAPPADAEPDARVIAPKSAAVLACPAGSKQVTRSRDTGSVSDPRVTELVCVTPDDQEQGPFALYDTHGALAQEGSYDHRELDGAFTEYRDGIKYQDGQYAKGVMTGTWTLFYSSGKPDCVSERANDQTVSLTCYSESGHVVARGKSPNGTDQGLWEWFHDDGTPEAAALYKDGDGVSYWIWKHGTKVKATYDEFAATGTKPTK